VTIVGGYVLVTHAMDDTQVTSHNGINTPTQLAPLFEGHRPADLVNSQVFLNRVTLEPTNAESVYYATDEKGDRMLVSAHSRNAPTVESVVNVMGIMRPVSTDMLKKWKLSKDEQKEAKAQGVYLDAETVKVKKPAVH